jgi:sulfoacetaldehyde dehydrogenase
MTVAVKSPAEFDYKPVIDEVMRRAHAAFASFRDVSQERADEAVRALAWSVYKPEHARELAALAVADTGLGNIPDKIVKNQRKTFGTLRDLLRAKSVGIIEEDKAKGASRAAGRFGAGPTLAGHQGIDRGVDESRRPRRRHRLAG